MSLNWSRIRKQNVWIELINDGENVYMILKSIMKCGSARTQEIMW